MAAEIRLFPCLSDNYGYLIHDPVTKATASIDAPEAASIIKALDAARAAGAVVETAMVLVDRQEGGTENLAAVGVKLQSLFKAEEFLR